MPGSGVRAYARTSRRAGAWALAALVLAGCQSTPSAPEPPAPRSAAAEPTLYRAVFRSIGGSRVRGSAQFTEVAGGVRMFVAVLGALPGPYRAWVHERGNCSSPNGFSAGAPWMPPGLPPGTAVPISYADGLGSGNFIFFLPGATLTGPNGVAGRSVVVHQGSIDSLDAVPDVPNGRVACGVVQRAVPFF